MVLLSLFRTFLKNSSIHNEKKIVKKYIFIFIIFLLQKLTIRG